MLDINKFENFLNPEPYKFAFEKFMLWLPLCIFSATIFVNILVPRFLMWKKYLHFGIATLVMFIINMAIAYFLGLLFFKYIYEAQSHRTLDPAFKPRGIIYLVYLHGVIFAGSISVLAAGIKFGKFLYLQEIENTRLAKEKSNNEMRIAKGSIRPAFLLRSLNSVYVKVRNMDADAPQVILQLSDLLSYILYDASELSVPLETELAMTSLSVEIEKINPENRVEFLLEINGEVQDKFITPLQLFTQMQFVVREVSNRKNDHDTCMINIEIGDNFINMRLSENLINKDLIHDMQSLRRKNETMISESELRIPLLPANNVLINF